MDFNYIENLIERYFECETTLHEEQILQNFFASEDIPAELLQYQLLFRTLGEEREVKSKSSQANFTTLQLTDIPARLNDRKNKRVINSSLNYNLKPFYKAVASVALVITAGVTSSQYWSAQAPEPIEYNYSNYHDTYSDPAVARETVADALKDLSNALRGSEDTLDTKN